ncbi:MAG TPA: L-arabinose isomerase, partial [Saprospiraceae bacterium]|nr:L-arabinose isomerase [Saprospiraceae bacterium]
MIANEDQKEVWFLTGSQHLYGDEILEKVLSHSLIISTFFDNETSIPAKVKMKKVLTTAEDIHRICIEANSDEHCIGIIAWMHTFSPAKMWINGLKVLIRPLLHLHTQFNQVVPWNTIDMDFMNLNQSAHGDREFGYMLTRMKVNRTIVTGHWESSHVVHQISQWVRAALGWNDWQGARYVRFGDNMRNVAVTEGDKVEAEIKLGYSVNTHGVGDLAAFCNQIEDYEIVELCHAYEKEYIIQPELKSGRVYHPSLKEAAKIELGLRKFLLEGNYKGFTTTFEDLYGLSQLPGIAVQRLMLDGYGFAAEGDWKTAALVRAFKVMATGLPGGNSFMEDYTYHFESGNEIVLGSHMLEICPSIADDKPSCEIHPLSIGGRADPVRLVFNVSEG